MSQERHDRKKVRLRVIALSYARLKPSAFMLILAQTDGPYHINMWIGEAEAHSIAIAMEGINPPRPLTHDLFTSFIHAFGIKLKEVFIYRVDEEIYSSELTFSDGERTITIDSRTSDGIAIAMRTGAPIYTTPEIIDEKGFLLDLSSAVQDGEGEEEEEADDDGADDDGESIDADSDDDGYGDDDGDDEGGEDDDDDDDDDGFDPFASRRGLDEPPLERLTIEELEKLLAKLIDREAYEDAARVNEIIRNKKKS